ncbi:Uncharacterised protein [Mycobacterium tuberculosis]|uniref:Uncharacterized protein n=1 Tax=Mycobacterium tuberculosis TaxID=1773 RepID=A0A916L8Y0_MYCTX|nr:Uncharacterised protein [Mycobacterium tuberculosis]CKR21866.1 Uncharacterised protein [Mycobacterium tuberculosis]COW35439.1 Uncharacterised protein [Mycobacterium tuberculosis]COX24126.1 Uncharacterised protein [Mycobacterium tuberculosis]COX54915.1 Uncharacterised protein [Mycobacterium tuberculosis]
MSVAARQFAEAGDACHSGHVVADSGLHQPVGYPGGLQKSASQFSFTELTAAIPISLRINVPRQSKDGSAVVAHGEPEL